MQVQGSLVIEEFRRIVERRARILRDTRNTLFLAFTEAVGYMLVEIGQQTPYLTGATRGAIKAQLQLVDQRILQYGGRKNFSKKLKMATTRSKEYPGVKPIYSSNLYAIKYTRTYRAGRHIKSRGDWRDYLMERGQNEGSSLSEGDSSFLAFGTVYRGVLSYRFYLGVKHWLRFDEEGVAQGNTRMRGPFRTVEDGLRVFNEKFDEIGNVLVQQALSGIFEVQA